MRKSLLICFLLFFGSLYISAHESRPLHLKITVVANQLKLELTAPNSINTQNLPIIYLNERIINEDAQWVAYPAGFRQKWKMSLTNELLKGSRIKVDYPVFNPVISTILSITHQDSTEQILLIPPNKEQVVIPKDPNVSEVRWQYSILGMEHIWAGIDHLLFLICLIIITGFSKKLFITITGFTLAHSITLVLSALKIVQLPIPPIEATIALSIVFLCYEIIHHHEEKDSLTYRYPILVASSFGLLHGFGFAAVLGEIGLPAKHNLEALLFFNIGVEIGQVIFITMLFLIISIAAKLGKRLLSVDTRKQVLGLGLKLAIYCVGILAAYWMFDRII